MDGLRSGARPSSLNISLHRSREKCRMSKKSRRKTTPRLLRCFALDAERFFQFSDAGDYISKFRIMIRE
jgi:hypothetical protein